MLAQVVPVSNAAVKEATGKKGRVEEGGMG
jgi:hypothetical protein